MTNARAMRDITDKYNSKTSTKNFFKRQKWIAKVIKRAKKVANKGCSWTKVKLPPRSILVDLAIAEMEEMGYKVSKDSQYVHLSW